MKRFSILLIISCSLVLAILCVLFVWHNHTKQNDEMFINEQKNKMTTSDYGDVKFKNTSGLERVLAFLNNSGDIIFDIPKNYGFKKNYVYGPINIEETILTGCVGEYFFNDDNFKQYLDESIECEGRLRRGREIEEMHGFSLSIPGGIYNAYIPTYQTITHCSITNPIVCWNENINKDEVLEYYYEHNKCPLGFSYYKPGVSGPTAYCADNEWYCHTTTCGYKNYGIIKVETCDLDRKISCYWGGYGPMVAIGDPCDFYRGIGVLPADGSCG